MKEFSGTSNVITVTSQSKENSSAREVVTEKNSNLIAAKVPGVEKSFVQNSG